MDGYILAWRWLAHAAVGGLIVLALGSLAVYLCRQPVRRARLVVLTLMGGFAVPWLGTLRILPTWSAGFVLSILPSSAPTSGETRPLQTSAAASASIELSRRPVALEGGRAELRRPVVRPAWAVALDGRRTGSWLSRLATRSWDALALTAYAALSAGLAAARSDPALACHSSRPSGPARDS